MAVSGACSGTSSELQASSTTNFTCSLARPSPATVTARPAHAPSLPTASPPLPPLPPPLPRLCLLSLHLRPTSVSNPCHRHSHHHQFYRHHRHHTTATASIIATTTTTAATTTATAASHTVSRARSGTYLRVRTQDRTVTDSTGKPTGCCGCDGERTVRWPEKSLGSEHGGGGSRRKGSAGL